MLAEPVSRISGQNTNVQHAGHVFHIQTEDSGVGHPHVISHVFADGGRIVATCKTSYAEIVARPNREEVVRRLVQRQHAKVARALLDGEFDEAAASSTVVVARHFDLVPAASAIQGVAPAPETPARIPSNQQRAFAHAAYEADAEPPDLQDIILGDVAASLRAARQGR